MAKPARKHTNPTNRSANHAAIIEAAGCIAAEAQCAPEFGGPHPDAMTPESALELFAELVTDANPAARRAVATLGIERAKAIYVRAFLGEVLRAA